MHARDQDAGGEGFPLNVADGAMRDAQMGEPGSQSFAQHADAGAEFDGVDGTYSHIVASLVLLFHAISSCCGGAGRSIART